MGNQVYSPGQTLLEGMVSPGKECGSGWCTEQLYECLQIVKFLAGAEMLIAGQAEVTRLGQGKGYGTLEKVRCLLCWR